MDLKQIRKSKGLTQSELAKEAGVSHSLVIKIEHGERKPSVRVAKLIASVLQFRWTDFYD